VRDAKSSSLSCLSEIGDFVRGRPFGSGVPDVPVIPILFVLKNWFVCCSIFC